LEVGTDLRARTCVGDCGYTKSAVEFSNTLGRYNLNAMDGLPDLARVDVHEGGKV
jgi:hypothetical protein